MIRYFLIGWSLIAALLLNRIVAQAVNDGEPFSTIKNIDIKLTDLSDKMEGLLDKTSQIESTSNSSQYELVKKMESMMCPEKHFTDIKNLIDMNTNVYTQDIKGFVSKIGQVTSSNEELIWEMERLWAEGYIPLMQSVFDASKEESRKLILASKEETNQIWTGQYIPQMQDAINASKEDILKITEDVNTLKGFMTNMEAQVTEMQSAIDASNNNMEQKIGGLTNDINSIKGFMTNMEAKVTSSQEALVSEIKNTFTTEYIPQMQSAIDASNNNMEQKIGGLTNDINSIKGLHSLMLNYITCEAKANCVLYDAWIYTFTDTPMSWMDGRKHCQAKGGDLFYLTRNEEFTILKERLPKEHHGHWIGLNDIKSEGSFIWTNDGGALNPVTHRDWWSDGQPDNYLDKEDCVHFLDQNNALNDQNCNTKRRSVCKFNLEDMTF